MIVSLIKPNVEEPKQKNLATDGVRADGDDDEPLLSDVEPGSDIAVCLSVIVEHSSQTIQVCYYRGSTHIFTVLCSLFQPPMHHATTQSLYRESTSDPNSTENQGGGDAHSLTRKLSPKTRRIL